MTEVPVKRDLSTLQTLKLKNTMGVGCNVWKPGFKTMSTRAVVTAQPLTNHANFAVDEGGVTLKILDVCFMVAAVALAVVFSPLVPLFFLYEAVFERRGPDHSQLNGHAIH